MNDDKIMIKLPGIKLIPLIENTDLYPYIFQLVDGLGISLCESEATALQLGAKLKATMIWDKTGKQVI